LFFACICCLGFVELAREELQALQRARKPDQAQITRIEETLEKHQKYASSLAELIDLINHDLATADELSNLKDGIEYYISDSQDPDFVEDEALFELIESKEEAKEKQQSKHAAEDDDEDEDGDGDDDDGEDNDNDNEDEDNGDDEDEPDDEEDTKPAPAPAPTVKNNKPTAPAPTTAAAVSKTTQQAPAKTAAAAVQQQPQPAVQQQPKQPEQPAKNTTPAAATKPNTPVAAQQQQPEKKNVPQTVQPSQPPQPQINFGALVNNTKAAAAAAANKPAAAAAVTPQTPTGSNAAATKTATPPAAVSAVAPQKNVAAATPVILQQPPQQQQPTAAAVVAASQQKQQQANAQQTAAAQQQAAAAQAAAAQQQQQAAAAKKNGPQQGIPAAVTTPAASVPKVQSRPQQGIPAAVVQQPKPLSYMEVIAKSNPNANAAAAAAQQKQIEQQASNANANAAAAVQQPSAASILDQLNEQQGMSMHHHLLQQHHMDASEGVMHDMAARLHALQMNEQQQRAAAAAFADLQAASAAAQNMLHGGPAENEDDANDETFGSAMVNPTIGSLEDFASQTIDVVHKDMPLFSLGLDNSKELNMLDVSLDKIPHPSDSEQPKLYYPQNPYKTPECFPSEPTPLFNDPSVIAKMDTDTLFFIFYFQQNTYQQYLAAKELKRQAWRYHKKYTTWFQRHDTPKQTTNEFELGTYVYFDYESHDGWCQRIKSGFRFEYEYLEDENL